MSEEPNIAASNLTLKIHEKADADLRKRINDAFDSVSRPLADKHAAPHLESRRAKYVRVEINGIGKLEKEVWPWTVVQAAKQALFEGCKDANRDEAVYDFMNRVYSLDREFAQYRDEIQEGGAE